MLCVSVRHGQADDGSLIKILMFSFFEQRPLGSSYLVFQANATWFLLPPESEVDDDAVSSVVGASSGVRGSSVVGASVDSDDAGLGV